MIDGKVAVAVVGCGGMGGGHAVAISTGSGQALWMTDGSKGRELAPGDTDLKTKMVLAGTYDVKEERQEWARNQGFHTYDSFEQILEDPQVDVVLVATPNDSHKDLSIRAMQAGKNVLCEKPVMMNSKDLEDVLEVAKETGKVFYPRQNRRWDKDYLIMKKLYEEKTLGDIFHIESRYHGSRGIPGDWRGVKAQGGGMMFDWGVHLLDRLVMMIPEKIKTVYAKMTHVTNDEVDDGFIMQMTFESGLTALWKWVPATSSPCLTGISAAPREQRKSRISGIRATWLSCGAGRIRTPRLSSWARAFPKPWLPGTRTPWTICPCRTSPMIATSFIPMCATWYRARPSRL